jgi:hypothetical protein
MERHKLCEAMARRIGQPLTVDMATEIVREAMPQQLAPAVLPTQPTREQIERFEGVLRQCDQAMLKTTHHFSPGLYAREIFIPAGTVLTGAAHKTEHLAVCVGDITVWTDEGMVRLTGHHILPSKPGAKRVGYAHADTWFTCFHATELTDLTQLEAELIEDAHLLQCHRPEHAAITAKESQPCLG